MRGLAPDVAVLAMRMPGLSGAEATRRLSETTAVPVVMLTVAADDRDVVEAVRAGARGYVLKDAPLEEIEAGGAPADEPPPVELSDRERDVLRLVAAGRDNAAIARELHLGTGTVRKYVSSILAKLGVDNRVEAAVYAVRRGLV